MSLLHDSAIHPSVLLDMLIRLADAATEIENTEEPSSVHDKELADIDEILWELCAIPEHAQWLFEHDVIPILLGEITHPHSSLRRKELATGALANMASCNSGLAHAISATPALPPAILAIFSTSEYPSLLSELARLITACICPAPNRQFWMALVTNVNDEGLSQAFLSKLQFILGQSLSIPLLERIVELTYDILWFDQQNGFVLLRMPELVPTVIECLATSLGGLNGGFPEDLILQLLRLIEFLQTRTAESLASSSYTLTGLLATLLHLATEENVNEVAQLTIEILARAVVLRDSASDFPNTVHTGNVAKLLQHPTFQPALRARIEHLLDILEISKGQCIDMDLAELGEEVLSLAIVTCACSVVTRTSSDWHLLLASMEKLIEKYEAVAGRENTVAVAKSRQVMLKTREYLSGDATPMQE